MSLRDWLQLALIIMAVFGLASFLFWVAKNFIKDCVREVIDEEFEDEDEGGK